MGAIEGLGDKADIIGRAWLELEDDRERVRAASASRHGAMKNGFPLKLVIREVYLEVGCKSGIYFYLQLPAGKWTFPLTCSLMNWFVSVLHGPQPFYIPVQL